MNAKLKWGIIILVIVVLIVGGFVWLQVVQHAKAVKLQTLASCIKDSGAIFYGAFWCPHCQNQKAMFNTLFESGDKNLPYVECSTPEGNSQLEICKVKGIKTYPTWHFVDGSEITGEATLQELANKTNCNY